MLPNLSKLDPVGAPEYAPVGDAEYKLFKRNEDEESTILVETSTKRLQAVKRFFAQTDPEKLKLNEKRTKNDLVPIAAYDVVYHKDNPMFSEYRSIRARAQSRRARKPCADYGPTRKECARTDQVLAPLAEGSIFGPLNDETNEKFLVHGTGPEGITGILHSNFDLQRPGDQWYGPGIYQAEEVGKADFYTTWQRKGWKELTEQLGLPTDEDVYYMLITRTLLGCANHVPAKPWVDKGDGSPWDASDFQSNIKDIMGRKAYYKPSEDSTTVEFANGFDSLIVEYGDVPRGHTGSGGREFLVRNKHRVLPVMVVAYVNKDTDGKTFDHAKLACDGHSGLWSLVWLLAHYRTPGPLPLPRAFRAFRNSYDPVQFSDVRQEVVARLLRIFLENSYFDFDDGFYAPAANTPGGEYYWAMHTLIEWWGGAPFDAVLVSQIREWHASFNADAAAFESSLHKWDAFNAPREDQALRLFDAVGAFLLKLPKDQALDELVDENDAILNALRRREQALVELVDAKDAVRNAARRGERRRAMA